jgi:hypothetical protein
MWFLSRCQHDVFTYRSQPLDRVSGGVLDGKGEIGQGPNKFCNKLARGASGKYSTLFLYPYIPTHGIFLDFFLALVSYKSLERRY